MIDRLEQPSRLRGLLWGRSLGSLHGPAVIIAMTGLVPALAIPIVSGIIPQWAQAALLCVQILVLLCIPLYGWLWCRYWDKVLND